MVYDMKLEDLTGQKFGRLTVLSRAENRNHHTYWNCVCECGAFSVVTSYHLTHGRTKSCGCLRSDATILSHTTHGLTEHPLYKVWRAMKERCYLPTNKRFEHYGGRGIKVCDEWKDDFVAFFEWSIRNGYEEGLSIDRINVDGNYEPNNCRWITMDEQSRNKTSNILLTYNGKTQCIAEWSREVGIKEATIRRRIKHGWSIEETLTTPVKVRD